MSVALLPFQIPAADKIVTYPAPKAKLADMRLPHPHSDVARLAQSALGCITMLTQGFEVAVPAVPDEEVDSTDVVVSSKQSQLPIMFTEMHLRHMQFYTWTSSTFYNAYFSNGIRYFTTSGIDMEGRRIELGEQRELARVTKMPAAVITTLVPQIPREVGCLIVNYLAPELNVVISFDADLQRARHFRLILEEC